MSDKPQKTIGVMSYSGASAKILGEEEVQLAGRIAESLANNTHGPRAALGVVVLAEHLLAMLTRADGHDADEILREVRAEVDAIKIKMTLVALPGEPKGPPS